MEITPELQQWFEGLTSKPEPYFFDWNNQKRYVLEFAWEYYKEAKLDEQDVSAEEAIHTAYDFIQQYHSLVLAKATREYYND